MTDFAFYTDREIQEVNDALVVMCALDNRPFNMVECRGFRYFVEKATKKRYVLPSRATLRSRSRTMADQLRAALKKQIQHDVDNGATFTLTFDGWTDRSVVIYS